MLPPKLTIRGNYWDSFIYSGYLYLWTFDGEVLVFDWNGILDSLVSETGHTLEYRCAFQRGDYLYSYSGLFDDPELKKLLTKKFARLSRKGIVLSKSTLGKFLIGKQRNPFPELPSDIDIFKSRVYCVCDEGLYAAACNRPHKSKYKVAVRPAKLWDCPLLSMSISGNGRIALSAGSEGLFEYDAWAGDKETAHLENSHFRMVESETPIARLSKHESLFADWNYSSLSSTSHVGEILMVGFSWDDKTETSEDPLVFENSRFLNRTERILNFARTVKSKEIFGEKKPIFSWGAFDKLYAIYDGRIRTIKFIQSNLKDETDGAFTPIGDRKFDFPSDQPISSGVTIFGLVVEYEEAICVLDSTGEYHQLPGHATKWRVFPRSQYYMNQLHVIYDDHMNIYSFNHDYFVAQPAKLYGAMYSPSPRRRTGYPLRPSLR